MTFNLGTVELSLSGLMCVVHDQEICFDRTQLACLVYVLFLASVSDNLSYIAL